MPASRTLVLTALALLGFAANSVLCRRALATGSIDAASFTAVRMAAGALALAVLVRVRTRGGAAVATGASWTSALALFGYAAAFSLAYRMLTAGTGALILFGCVQATMFGYGVARGERLHVRQWLGVVLALGGLVALTAPGVEAPPPAGALLMGAAGVAWGIYSIRGRGVADPLAATAGNFVRTLPFAGAMVLAGTPWLHAGTGGVLLAAASGALASGVAYSLWYAALRGLTATRAAIVQLCVPALAAIGGALAIGEVPTPRSVAAGAAILLGVAAAIGRGNSCATRR